MNKKPTFSKHINRDVVLCETTNRLVSNRASELLMECSVPFSKYPKKVPFFKRRSYNGASTIYVISTNRTQYGNARRALFSLKKRDYDRLTLNVI